jgi:DnaJ-class molecular chaperone
MTSGSRETPPDTPPSPRKPGDEARPGSKQSGDQICPDCGGTGRVEGADCPSCAGTGRVTAIVGDA